MANREIFNIFESSLWVEKEAHETISEPGKNRDQYSTCNRLYVRGKAKELEDMFKARFQAQHGVRSGRGELGLKVSQKRRLKPMHGMANNRRVPDAGHRGKTKPGK